MFIHRHPLLLPAILAIIVDAAYISFVYRPNQEQLVAEFSEHAGTGEAVFVRGEVMSVRSPVPATRNELKYRFRIKNPTVNDGTGTFSETLSGTLPVIWYSTKPGNGGFAPEAGAMFDLRGKLYKRRALGDTDATLLNDVFLVTRARDTMVLESKTGNSGGILSDVRASAAERLSRGLENHIEEKTLVLAMTLGFRSDIPSGTIRKFRYAGTIHIFAISGLHVMMIAKILSFLIGVFGVSKRWWALILAPLLTAYVFMTGGQPSAMRACLMALLYFSAPMFNRKPDPLNSISLALLILLAADPLDLTDLGFILSFSMVTGLVLFTSPFIKMLHVLFRLDSLLAVQNLFRAAENPTGLWERFKFSCRHPTAGIVKFSTDILAVSITSALISFPLTSYFFGFCTPYSLLANIAVVPIATLLMTSSAIAITVSCLHPSLSVPFNMAAGELAGAMKWASMSVARIPGSAPKVNFTLAAVLIWYAGLFVLCRFINRRFSKQSNRSGSRPLTS